MIRHAFLIVALLGCGRRGFDEISDAGGPGDTSMELDAAPTASCQGGLAMGCGATGSSDCCASSAVPGGTFLRSYDSALDSMYADPTFSAIVSAFRLDTYEVTVGRFRAFVDAGQGTRLTSPSPGSGAHAKIAGSGWTAAMTAQLPMTTAELRANLACATDARWTDAPGANENHALDCVSWHEAMAFCIWDGGYLPSEAEWNFAAAGGSEQRAFPWSSPAFSTAIDTSRASYNAQSTFFVVGAKPAGNGRWGHADLAGGLWEWTIDRRVVPYPVVFCNDCATLTGGSDWTVRGGSLFDGPANLRAGTRSRDNSVDPGVRQPDVGVRCARPL